jgi:transposase
VGETRKPLTPGETAHAAGQSLNSRRIAALPVLDRFIKRLRLHHFLTTHLATEDRRTRVPNPDALLLLVRNILVSREPLYGVAEWALRHEPATLGLDLEHLDSLNDDRVGRALDRLFDVDVPSFVLDVVAHAVREFNVDLDELHNDSTTVTFHGEYESATHERLLRGRLRPAITWGHNKDHRPDLKQLLYILTVSRDGAVPVHFRVGNGNATDDRSHRETWDLLRKLTGRADFLYVADCKLATSENMAYIDRNGGRFVSVLPRTRTEDRVFRAAVREGKVVWRQVHDKCDDDGELLDRFSTCEPAVQTAEGYRLLWLHSTRKAADDAGSRLHRVDRALSRLEELRVKLASPRTRYRTRAKVDAAVEALLRECGVAGEVAVEIVERAEATYRQVGPGRPSAETQYVRSESVRFEITPRVEYARLEEESRCDGVFPLVSNDRTMTCIDLLLSYKDQPALERRFEQLKTDFCVAPMYLKEASRIHAVLCLYFLVLLVESLLERELRGGMGRCGVESLPLYPEQRACRRPTARRVIDLFEEVQRHTLSSGEGPPIVFMTELTALQQEVLHLLGMPDAYNR